MNAINQYLEENNFSEKSKDFAKTMINAAIIEKQIDDTNLNACEKDVLKSVISTSVCDIAEVLTRINANKSVYTTIIKSAVTPSGAPAQTVKTQHLIIPFISVQIMLEKRNYSLLRQYFIKYYMHIL